MPLTRPLRAEGYKSDLHWGIRNYMALPPDLQQHFHTKLGLAIRRAQLLSGGCIHQAHVIDTDQGKIFVKYNRADQQANFVAEAQGLDILRQAQALPVPSLIDQGQTEHHAYLALQYVASGEAGPRYWEMLGAGLAALHQHTAPRFGLGQANFIGALPQANDWQGSWADFYPFQRIGPMLEMGRARGYIDASLSTAVENMLIKRADFFPPSPPALLHGDLWGGNILTGPQGQAWLIDPAVYYGHREMELAFMSLFDRQPPVFYAAYQERFPLAPGFQDRMAYQQLYPLLVHVNLFGSSYLPGVRAILNRFG